MDKIGRSYIAGKNPVIFLSNFVDTLLKNYFYDTIKSYYYRRSEMDNNVKSIIDKQYRKVPA